MNELKLHDIKPLVEVSDYSFYIFILLIVLALTVVFTLIYLLVKKFKFNKTNTRKNNIEKLTNIDFENPKKCAYEMTKLLRSVCKNPREKNLANEIIYLLQDYKYKKDVSPINDEIKKKYHILMDVIDA